MSRRGQSRVRARPSPVSGAAIANSLAAASTSRSSSSTRPATPSNMGFGSRVVTQRVPGGSAGPRGAAVEAAPKAKMSHASAASSNVSTPRLRVQLYEPPAATSSNSEYFRLSTQRLADRQRRLQQLRSRGEEVETKQDSGFTRSKSSARPSHAASSGAASTHREHARTSRAIARATISAQRARVQPTHSHSDHVSLQAAEQEADDIEQLYLDDAAAASAPSARMLPPLPHPLSPRDT